MLRTLSSLTLLASLMPVASALDFRIETKLYMGDEELPIVENTTLFQNGVIYDFVENTGRVAIFHDARGERAASFVLMDPSRSVKTEIELSRMDTAIEKLCKAARQSKNALDKFSAVPNFSELFDQESGVLTLESEPMTYRLGTVPVDHEEAWGDLRNYFDGYAKLNCILAFGRPPKPRLEVNNALRKYNVVPVQVNLSISGDEAAELRAEHFFTWRLSKDDRARIALVGEQLVSFNHVSNAEFREGTVAAKD